MEVPERGGCAVVFVNGPGGTTPKERLVREVHGLFAECERAAPHERSRPAGATEGEGAALTDAPWQPRAISTDSQQQPFFDLPPRPVPYRWPGATYRSCCLGVKGTRMTTLLPALPER